MKDLPWILIILMSACTAQHSPDTLPAFPTKQPYVMVLGTVQDGGSPHIGCDKACCRDLFENPDPNRLVVSLGITDPATGKTFLIEASPDMPAQLKMLNSSGSGKKVPDGIFLTHAHIGHYTGLMYLGREALGGNNVPVYAMPRMAEFLSDNGPWSQLVALENIQLRKLKAGVPVRLTPSLTITPFLVPHRDEYSETVGYRIDGPESAMLFIPDIDKWHKWDRDIRKEIASVDYALLDGSFYDAEEINYRDISEIPHPFLTESMEYFRDMPVSEKNKISFIHFNHTNPVLAGNQEVLAEIENAGFHVCNIHQVFKL